MGKTHGLKKKKKCKLKKYSKIIFVYFFLNFIYLFFHSFKINICYFFCLYCIYIIYINTFYKILSQMIYIKTSVNRLMIIVLYSNLCFFLKFSNIFLTGRSGTILNLVIWFLITRMVCKRSTWLSFPLTIGFLLFRISVSLLL